MYYLLFFFINNYVYIYNDVTNNSFLRKKTVIDKYFSFFQALNLCFLMLLLPPPSSRDTGELFIDGLGASRSYVDLQKISFLMIVSDIFLNLLSKIAFELLKIELTDL